MPPPPTLIQGAEDSLASHQEFLQPPLLAWAGPEAFPRLGALSRARTGGGESSLRSFCLPPLKQLLASRAEQTSTN